MTDPTLIATGGLVTSAQLAATGAHWASSSTPGWTHFLDEPELTAGETLAAEDHAPETPEILP